MIDCNVKNPVFLAWCAAWLEGEGWVTLFRRSDVSLTSFQIKAEIAQVNREPLDMILAGFPQGRIYYYRNLHFLQYASAKAVMFLKPLLPFLTFKRERAEIVIEAQAIISHRYNRWHPRPQAEVDELYRLKERLHQLTGVTLATRVKRHGLRLLASRKTE